MSIRSKPNTKSFRENYDAVFGCAVEDADVDAINAATFAPTTCIEIDANAARMLAEEKRLSLYDATMELARYRFGSQRIVTLHELGDGNYVVELRD